MRTDPSAFAGVDRRPVEQVSWDDIQAFEARAGLLLPSEAQWEYACRATITTPIAGTGKLDDMGWFKENSVRMDHPVGRKAPNGFGLYDTHGNVWEWCEEVYDHGIYGKPEGARPDPVSLTGSWIRVTRGGCWRVGAGGCRSSDRGGFPPEYRFCILGFRLACRAP
jgi:formylglycine-generating enzyme required for sulfatase activity